MKRRSPPREDEAFVIFLSLFGVIDPLLVFALIVGDAVTHHDGQYALFALPILLFATGVLPLALLTELGMLFWAVRLRSCVAICSSALGIVAAVTAGILLWPIFHR